MELNQYQQLALRTAGHRSQIGVFDAGAAANVEAMDVDDHDVVRQGVHAFLDALPDFVVVGEARSGEDAQPV